MDTLTTDTDTSEINSHRHSQPSSVSSEVAPTVVTVGSSVSSPHTKRNTRQQAVNPVRPTRENVLRRLSEALMRRSLTLIDLSQRGLQPSDARLVKLALLQNASLSDLKLGYNNLSDEGVITLASGISNHTALTSLDLGFNNVGNQGCAALSSAIVSCIRNGGAIHTLYLAGNRITEDGAHALAQLFREGSGRGLKRIHLTGNKIGPEGMRALMEAVAFHQSTSLSDSSQESGKGVEELFLGGTGMGHLGCVAVAKMLETTKSLRVLSLSNCDLNDNDALVLASAITKNCKELPLEILQLSFNNLTSKGIEALMNAVWGLTRLKELQLDNNKMEGRGAQVVSAVLGGVKTLQKLDVGFNAITGTGMKLLMKAVAENSNLISLTISGNAIDVSSAKAVAYALAHNSSLKSIYLDHCAIPREGERHIAAGIVSNSNTVLEVMTGFLVGGNVVSLGLPASLERWSNEQVLKFILFMWNQMRQEQDSNSIDKDIDPLNLLPSAQARFDKSGPLDPATVVAVAKRAFGTLNPAGDEHLFQGIGSRHEACFDCPVTEDAVIMEADGAHTPTTQEDSQSNSMQVNEGHDIIKPLSPPIPDDLFVTKSQPPLAALDAATKKKNTVEWVCKNIQHLNELLHLPFNSSELWRLHQHFSSPTIQMTCRSSKDVCVGGSDVGMNSFSSSHSPGSSILSAPCQASPSADAPGVPSSEPVMNGKLSMLKRKVSYRFLGEATVSSGSEVKNVDQSVSELIENMSGQLMQPKIKRARRNITVVPRIKLVPRIKEKLDSFLDCDHQKALGLMRQLYYVEKSLLNGNVYPVDEVGTATHLIGELASDAETIILDMM